MTFWRMTAPEYRTDAEDTRLNGELDHRHSLPGVKCDACGQTWSGLRVLPVALPEALEGREALRESWPISAEAHRALRAETEAALAKQGHLTTLHPGDDFQPASMRLRTFPEVDFLWPPFSTVVSARMRDLLAARALAGVHLCPVSFARPAKPRGAAAAPPPPEYFELIVTAESGLPPGVRTVGTCVTCGREELDLSGRVFDVGPEQWKGLYLVVTDGLKAALEQAGATNVRFVPFPLHDE